MHLLLMNMRADLASAYSNCIMESGSPQCEVQIAPHFLLKPVIRAVSDPPKLSWERP